MARAHQVFLTLMAFVAAATAFTHSSHTIGKSAFSNVSPAKPMTFPKVNESKTMLMERRWNFNEARGPWGMKKNAEIWNGRVAQVCTNSTTYFVIMLIAISLEHIFAAYFMSICKCHRDILITHSPIHHTLLYRNYILQ